MKGFIEVTRGSDGTTMLININHIICVTDNWITLNSFDIGAGYHSSYGGNVSIEVVEKYDQIRDKIWRAS